MNIDDLIGHVFMFSRFRNACEIPGAETMKVCYFTDVILFYKTGEEITRDIPLTYPELDRGVTYARVLRTPNDGGPVQLIWSPINSYVNGYWELVR